MLSYKLTIRISKLKIAIPVVTLAVIAVVIGAGPEGMAQDEFLGRGQSQSSGAASKGEGEAGEDVLGTPTAEVTGAPVLSVVPSVAVSETYDSNVLFVAGQQKDDYVTRITPQATAELKGRLMSGTLQAGLTGAYYVRNPDLNYVGANGGLTLNLDNVVNRVVPRLRIQVSDFVTYTPQPPAFLNPEARAGGQSDIFARGIQVARADSIQNTSAITGSYTLVPRVSLNARYAYSFMKFFNTFATPDAGTFVDTTSQSANIGVQTAVTRQDNFNVSYTYSLSSFGQGAGGIGSFTSHAGTLTWSHQFTRTLSGSLAGGATAAVPDSGATSLNFTGSASLNWVQGKTPMSLNFSRAITPSYYVAGTALISDAVSVSARYPLTPRLGVSGSANYGQNSSSLTDVSLSFYSVGGTIGFSYVLIPGINANLIYNYNHFQQDFQGASSEFDRHFATLAISAVWR